MYLIFNMYDSVINFNMILNLMFVFAGFLCCTYSNLKQDREAVVSEISWF